MFTSEFRKFEGFGPSRVSINSSSSLSVLQLGSDQSLSRKALRQKCEMRPGVYGMWDSDGELIYVGKAKRLLARLKTYFGAKTADQKAHRILARTSTLAWEHTPDEFGALVRELELIRRWRPRFNVQGQPGRSSRGFICLGRSPAPYFYLSGRVSSRTMAAFGPVPMGGSSREAVRRLNDLFRLRDCPQERTMIFADQKELFQVDRTGACIRYEIDNCMAPCVGACTRRQYSAKARAAKALLSGQDLRLLEQLRREMQLAAADRQFERAAQLRDTSELLQRLIDNLEYLKHVSAEFFFIYPVTTFEGAECWYLIRGGVVMQCIAAPHCASTSALAARQVEGVFLGKDTDQHVNASDFGETLLTASWFRRNPLELQRVLTPFQALERCREAAQSYAAQA